MSVSYCRGVSVQHCTHCMYIRVCSVWSGCTRLSPPNAPSALPAATPSSLLSLSSSWSSLLSSSNRPCARPRPLRLPHPPTHFVLFVALVALSGPRPLVLLAVFVVVILVLRPPSAPRPSSSVRAVAVARAVARHRKQVQTCAPKSDADVRRAVEEDAAANDAEGADSAGDTQEDAAAEGGGRGEDGSRQRAGDVCLAQTRATHGVMARMPC